MLIILKTQQNLEDEMEITCLWQRENSLKHYTYFLQNDAWHAWCAAADLVVPSGSCVHISVLSYWPTTLSSQFQTQLCYTSRLTCLQIYFTTISTLLQVKRYFFFVNSWVTQTQILKWSSNLDLLIRYGIILCCTCDTHSLALLLMFELLIK